MAQKQKLVRRFGSKSPSVSDILKPRNSLLNEVIGKRAHFRVKFVMAQTNHKNHTENAVGEFFA